MIEVLLRTWPVPAGHEGTVVDPQAKAQDWVEIKHLLEGGFLSAGDELIPVSSTYADVRALVLENGQLEVRGQKFDSPAERPRL